MVADNANTHKTGSLTAGISWSFKWQTRKSSTIQQQMAEHTANTTRNPLSCYPVVYPVTAHQVNEVRDISSSDWVYADRTELTTEKFCQSGGLRASSVSFNSIKAQTPPLPSPCDRRQQAQTSIRLVVTKIMNVSIRFRGYGRTHAHAFAKLPGVRVVAVSSRIGAEKLAQKSARATTEDMAIIDVPPSKSSAILCPLTCIKVHDSRIASRQTHLETVLA
jgi:hypothetical protein